MGTEETDRPGYQPARSGAHHRPHKRLHAGLQAAWCGRRGLPLHGGQRPSRSPAHPQDIGREPAERQSTPGGDETLPQRICGLEIVKIGLKGYLK